MDLSMYPNLAAVVQRLGGIKKTVVNKKMLENADLEFSKIPQEFLMNLEREIPGGVQVMTNFVTPSAFIILNMHVLQIIPTADVIWIYPSVTTMRMNFIPYSKQHSLFLLTRRNETFNLGFLTTGGFSKKQPLDAHIQNIASVVKPSRPGMILGWSDQVANAASNNLAGLIQSVDAQNANR